MLDFTLNKDINSNETVHENMENTIVNLINSLSEMERESQQLAL